MRILLQDYDTNLYLDMVGDWTELAEHARTFPNTVQATDFKLRRRLRHAFVVVLADPPAQPAAAVPLQAAAVPAAESLSRVPSWEDRSTQAPKLDDLLARGFGR